MADTMSSRFLKEIEEAAAGDALKRAYKVLAPYVT
jgi:hypothetical protein